MTAADLATLLAQCRAHPGPGMRGILADALRDTDGDTPATAQLGTDLACERCGCPDSPKPMALDRARNPPGGRAAAPAPAPGDRPEVTRRCRRVNASGPG